jgi:hypothetical protein
VMLFGAGGRRLCGFPSFSKASTRGRPEGPSPGLASINQLADAFDRRSDGLAFLEEHRG